MKRSLLIMIFFAINFSGCRPKAKSFRTSKKGDKNRLKVINNTFEEGLKQREDLEGDLVNVGITNRCIGGDVSSQECLAQTAHLDEKRCIPSAVVYERKAVQLHLFLQMAISEK